MQGWHTTFLGMRGLPRDISDFEMKAFFTFDGAERDAIKQLRDTETGQHYGYLAELPSWLYQQIVQTAADGRRLVNVVGLDPGYFDLTGGLERWLYLWARKSVDAQRGDWDESFRSLYIKSGSTNSEKQFRFNLRKIIKRNSMIGYELSEIIGRNGPRLGVVRRTGSDLLMSVNQLRLV